MVVITRWKMAFSRVGPPVYEGAYGMSYLLRRHGRGAVRWYSTAHFTVPQHAILGSGERAACKHAAKYCYLMQRVYEMMMPCTVFTAL